MSHPVDATGLVLPEPSWPDRPGSAGILEPLRRFCNTTNDENGADAWRTPMELAAWLDAEGYDAVGTVDDTALTRLISLRQAMRDGVCSGDYERFARLAGQVAVRLDGVTLVPAEVGIDGVVARLALAACAGAAAGELDRLKSCHHCRWVFHDASKNRRGRWCSMAACGGRNKARAYRRRRIAGAR
jgi:predicted RNA-binding Zn ribbon-like protein